MGRCVQSDIRVHVHLSCVPSIIHNVLIYTFCINRYTSHCAVRLPLVLTSAVSAPRLCDRDRGYDLRQKIKRFDNGLNRYSESEWDAE